MRKVRSVLYIIAFAFILLFPVKAFAQEATVTFGSESYNATNGKDFNVGVYIQSDEPIGSYRVELEYDKSRLRYIGGAESEADGVVVLEGTGFDKSVRYRLTFRGTSGGNAGIVVKDAIINQRASEGGSSLEVSEKSFSPIVVSGRNEQQFSFAEILEERERIAKEEEAQKIENRYPILETVTTNAGRLYLIDHKEYVPQNVDWNYIISEVNINGTDAAGLSDKDNRAYIVYLMDETEGFHPYAISDDGKKLYQVYEAEDAASEKYLYVTALAAHFYPANVNDDIVSRNNIAFVLDKSGTGKFAQISEAGEIIEWKSHEDSAVIVENEPADETPTYNDGKIDETKNNSASKMLIAIAVVALISGIVLISVSVVKNFEKSEESLPDTKKNNYVINLDDQEYFVYDEDDDYVYALEEEEDSQEADSSKVEVPAEKDEPVEEDNDLAQKPVPEAEKPVISIQNVTMKFKVSTSDASGLKEFLIQKIKKKVTYRELLALNDVSFDIYKGEVVGIIGTNGSGKSTLLRIVSGALQPTSGQVVVDRSKVQLLTLGTGFDMELTARENVYLNGAIIGYTKKFLDDHFDEIIEFAELQDFVDEKVKNFSSGMVSRLGFAIATVGDAAEILILDEVLSVGDEFFRKKSLARIKEMIHGGSTVLMVSHGMGTILENCTKAAWIEKGVLKMVGDTKTVCDEYQAMGGI